MQKELKDITEEDIKQVWRDTGHTVSWQNSLHPVGFYAFNVSNSGNGWEKFGLDEYVVERKAYEIQTGYFDSVDEFRSNMQQMYEDLGKVTFKYYTHSIQNDKLVIRLSWFSDYFAEEASKEEIIKSINDDRYHPNHKDVRHFYNLD